MGKFIKNTIKMSASNILTLISGVLVGFLIPKVMGLEDFAMYKIYTLYVGYLTLLSLGIGDGLNLRFAGCEKDNLDKPLIAYYLHRYYLQLGVMFIVAILFAIFMLPEEYKFIGIALSITLVSGNIVSLHQNLSLITSRFNEYSIRTIIKAGFTSVFVIVLFILNMLESNEISYQLYIIGIIIIEGILAFWYIWSYRDISFTKEKRLTDYETFPYLRLIALGFPLLLSNMAGTVFLSLDRQFVSVLFVKTDYAVYAFAYNMLSLITVMTSAVSLVLFPSLKKIKELDIKSSLEKFSTIFLVIVSMCLLVYFPLCLFVEGFLDKYVHSLEIFRIVLPGILLSSSISVILINFYKLENQVKRYFYLTVISIGISAFLNYFAYKMTKSYLAISWASIISLGIWYILVLGYFIKKYHINCSKYSIYALINMMSFYLITSMKVNTIIQAIIYLLFYLFFTGALYKEEISELLNYRRK